MHLKRLGNPLNLFPWKNNDTDRPACEVPVLRRRLLLSLGLSLTGLLGMLSVTNSAILTRGYTHLENQMMRRNLERVVMAYNQRLEELTNLNISWSVWDDSYAFVQQPNEAFVNTNLAEDASLHSTLSVILYINSSGEVVYSRGYAPDAEATLPVSDSVLAHIRTNSDILQHPNLKECQSGVMLLKEPLLYTSCPILTSQHKGPIAGTLLMGRYVDASFVRQLSHTIRLDLKIHALNRFSQLSPHLQSIFVRLQSGLTEVVQPLDDRTVEGYTLIHSAAEEPELLIQITHSREIYRQGKKSLVYSILALLIVGLIFGAVILWLTERLIQFWQRQREYEVRYQAVVAQASEGIVLIDGITKEFLESNAAFCQLLGYSAAEISNLTLFDIDTADPEAIEQSLQFAQAKYPDSHALNFQKERQYRHRQGQLIEVEVSISYIEYADRRVCFLVVRDITERKRAEVALRESEQRLAWQASHDSLTGLVNRRQFEQYLEQAIRSTHANVSHQHTLCYLDLDQFKVVNDTCGHHAGDELLRQVTLLLQSQVRATDILARLGGDEFGLLLQHCASQQAAYIADSLRQRVQDFRFVWEGRVFSIGVSIGLVEISAQTEDLTTALSAADAACYQAKNAGRNRVCIHPVEQTKPLQHKPIHWATQITSALNENRFCLYYQPILPLVPTPGTQQREHYEILLRLRDEAGQLVPPSAFLPAAERHHLMTLIDRWVIRTVFQSQGKHYRQAWERSQTEDFSCWYTINLSGASLADTEFAEFLHQQFVLHQIPPQVICFEIAETVAIAHLHRASQFIQEFRQLGCRFALDDFGSGISSFTYLKHLPVHFLKIDGTFVKDILHDPTDLALVDAINQVGHVTGLQTIAEFVQDQEILEKLRAIGVDYAQGYGIMPPVPLPLPPAPDSPSLSLPEALIFS